ncbi:hypothetical protein BT09C9_09340 [Escherichia coli]|nr:hypothetical protein R9P_03280 [Escherichia coli]
MAASLAVVKAARKEKPVCASGGRCVNLTPSPVLESPVCVCIRAFLRAAFHKNATLAARRKFL